MPLYEFVCRECDQQQELLVRGEQQPECEKCGSDKLLKKLSVVAGTTQVTSDPSPPSGSCGSGCGCFPG